MARKRGEACRSSRAKAPKAWSSRTLQALARALGDHEVGEALAWRRSDDRQQEKQASRSSRVLR